MAERARRREEAAALRIRGLHVYYGQSHALQGVDLDLPHGVVSVVGRNGMGKTTLCNAIMGLAPIARGSHPVRGRRAGRPEPEPDRAPRRRLRAPGTAPVGVAYRGRAPAPVRARRPRWMDARADLRRLSATGRAAREPGRPALGRRAADARDLARDAPESAPAGDGRAYGGARARDRAAGRGHADPDRRGGGDLGPRHRAEHRSGHRGIGRRRDHGQRPHPPDHGRGRARRRPRPAAASPGCGTPWRGGAGAGRSRSTRRPGRAGGAARVRPRRRPGLDVESRVADPMVEAGAGGELRGGRGGARRTPAPARSLRGGDSSPRAGGRARGPRDRDLRHQGRGAQVPPGSGRGLRAAGEAGRRLHVRPAVGGGRAAAPGRRLPSEGSERGVHRRPRRVGARDGGRAGALDAAPARCRGGDFSRRLRRPRRWSRPRCRPCRSGCRRS